MYHHAWIMYYTIFKSSKIARCVSQVVEPLPSEHKALHSNPILPKGSKRETTKVSYGACVVKLVIKKAKELGTVGSHLASWEAEIRSLKVEGQPGQIVHKTPSPK
jgi:hypothetical protein